jgi:hypothetical protein
VKSGNSSSSSRGCWDWDTKRTVQGTTCLSSRNVVGVAPQGEFGEALVLRKPIKLRECAYKGWDQLETVPLDESRCIASALPNKHLVACLYRAVLKQTSGM